ncbi:ROK family protein [Nonomuraea montanisoli]|uniref:ROK family protein n=1 Tax=Nonomuraea montanisoli TaxID=2741721 RepID=UPI002E2D782A|nr:ROK family transcriptional regulator [Nonomuraea montanisoli]
MILAIDVGGSKLAAGSVGRDGVVVEARRVATPRGADAETLWKTLVGLVESLVAPGVGPVEGVGVACGGPMRWPAGDVSPLNIPGWRGFPLRARLAERFPGVPVRLHNDAVCVAVAEHWRGAGQGTRDMLGMVVSTGVGGGLVLGGRLVDGGTGNAGHIGHVVVEPVDGPPCGCGGRGCLEAVARGPALTAWALARGWVPGGGVPADLSGRPGDGGRRLDDEEGRPADVEGPPGEWTGRLGRPAERPEDVTRRLGRGEEHPEDVAGRPGTPEDVAGRPVGRGGGRLVDVAGRPGRAGEPEEVAGCRGREGGRPEDVPGRPGGRGGRRGDGEGRQGHPGGRRGDRPVRPQDVPEKGTRRDAHPYREDREVTARALAADARAGDEVALAAMRRAGHALGVAIASATHLCDLELVTVGGGLAQAGEPLFGPLEEALRAHARMGFARRVRVTPAALGQDAGLVGAAALVLAGDRYWSSPQVAASRSATASCLGR